MKTVKVGWVFYINLKKEFTSDANWKSRGANFFEFVFRGYRLTIGMPWNKAFVEYELLHSFGKSPEKMEESNKQMLRAPGFKIKMPKRKYTICH